MLWSETVLEIRIEGGRPLGRSQHTRLEHVEADMAELMIDDRQRRCPFQEDMEKECYEEEVKLY